MPSWHGSWLPPEGEIWETEQGKTTESFINLSRKWSGILPAVFCWLPWPVLIGWGREVTRGMAVRRRDHCRPPCSQATPGITHNRCLQYATIFLSPCLPLFPSIFKFFFFYCILELSLKIYVLVLESVGSSSKCSLWKEGFWTSQAVQWVRLSTSTAGGTGLIPGRGTKIPQAHVAWPKKKKKRGFFWRVREIFWN